MTAVPVLVLLAAIPVAALWALLHRMASKAVFSRRRDSLSETIALVAVATFLIGCFSTWWLGVGVAGIALVALLAAKREKRRYEIATQLISEHAKELAIHRARTMVARRYGTQDRSRWDREINEFMNAVLTPRAGGFQSLDLCQRLRDEIERVAGAYQLDPSFADDMSPIAYEHLVASRLRGCGWEAGTTKASGDQGVDVLATKGRLHVVLQCKLYSRPVGNAAVQEVIAARQFERATHAVVVSNSSFTRGARELAASAAVLLLHHEELGQLEQMLGTKVPETAVR